MHTYIKPLALCFLLAHSASAQAKELEGYFSKPRSPEEICELSRKAMDEFLKYHPQYALPQTLEPLGINPETRQTYVMAKCPYTPSPPPQTSPAPQPEALFLGV